MTFLDDSTLWPRDLSGKRIFLVKAVEEMAREFVKKEVRLPPCVYRYNFSLPTFIDASEDDKMVVASIINHNTAGNQVMISEEACYSETLALQLRFSAEMCLPSLRLVGTSPAGPCDDPCQFNLLEGKPHNDAPDLLH